MSEIVAWLNEPLLSLGKWQFTPFGGLKLFVLPILLFVAAKIIRRFFVRRMRATSVDPSVIDALASLGYYVFIIVGLVAIIHDAGVDLTSLAVLTGALGLGVGLGLQSIAKNFISGLILLVSRPIRRGDRIEQGEVVGDVKRIGAYSTILLTPEDSEVIIPNSLLLEQPVTNRTLSDRTRLIKTAVGVHYDSNADQVREILERVASETEGVMAEPAPEARLAKFGESNLQFELLIWTDQFATVPGKLLSRIHFGILKAFGEAGISVPYPQRVVHHTYAEKPDTGNSPAPGNLKNAADGD